MDKEELKELIIEWFSHIEQMSTDRKTLNGDVMGYQECLDEIRRLAKDSRKLLKKMWCKYGLDDSHFEIDKG